MPKHPRLSLAEKYPFPLSYSEYMKRKRYEEWLRKDKQSRKEWGQIYRDLKSVLPEMKHITKRIKA